MRVKTYHYEINECIRGVFEGTSKRDAKRYCESLGERFFPKTGIKSMSIEKIKKKKRLVSE